MSNQADHTIVRLRVPPELKQKIEESAEKNNRSQSAEMVARLEQSFNPAPSGLSREQLEQITQAAGASYMAVIAKHLDMLSEDEGNKLLRNIVKDAAKDFERIKKAP
ncbi:Arc family DNA-binding protein [Acinetobacter schindleri]|uniref:Arc family DNA-binding protein n=1 Tax=Acinetobacter schindleri TaxID=108981 RepID=UPI0023600814|nr:Arc family DNA-binding protein [Acinetobacter schindleri]